MTEFVKKIYQQLKVTNKTFIVVLISLSFVTSLLSLKLAGLIAEKYFFDILFYHKSEKFGYTKGYGYDFENSSKYVLERVADLLELKSKKIYSDGSSDSAYPVASSNVLGAEAQDVYRVVVIGDSFAYGVGIKNEERFSIRLAKELNKIRPTRVYTLAYSGDDIVQYATNYELAEAKIRPDLVILTMVNNDFQIHVMDQDGRENKVLASLKNQCSGKIFWLEWMESYQENWNNYVIEQLYPAAQDEYANSCILSKAIVKMDKTKTIFIPMEPTSHRSGSYQDFLAPNQARKVNYIIDQIMQKYIDIVTSQNGYVLQFDYSKIPDNLLRVSKEEGHYSAYANEKLADFIFNEIISNIRWKFNDYNDVSI